MSAISGYVVTRHKWEIIQLRDRFFEVEEKTSNSFSLNYVPSTKFMMFFNSCVPLAAENEDLYPLGVMIKESNDDHPIKATVKFWLETGRGFKFGEHLITDFDFDEPDKKCGFVLQQGKEFKFFNDCFKENRNVLMCCELKYQIPDKTQHPLAKEIREQTSDAVICVGERRFPVIKKIIIGASPEFAALFSSNVNRTKPNEVSVYDVTPKALEVMIQYIYLGCVANLGPVCEEVFVAATNYGLQSLKTNCLKAMSEQLTKTNIFARLLLAFDYDEPKLKQKTLEFVLQKPHIEYLMPFFIAEEWFKLYAANKELAEKIYKAIFEKL